MRIRKNTKLASMLLATAGYGGEIPETYTCHLNQSPWDVIPVSSFGDGELTNLLDSSWFLPSPSSSSSPPLIHKFNGDDSFNGNVSLGDCNGTAERLNFSIQNNNHSLVSLERLNLTAAADNYERSPDVEDPMDQSDYFDKKSKAFKPNSLVKTSGNDDQVAATTPAPPKRGRPRGTGKKLAPVSTPATTNPYEFYYYSGFGPLWGRKRGGDSGEDNKIVMGGDEKSNENNMNKKSKSSSSSDEDDGKTMAFGSGSSSFDYVEEDYNEVVDEESDRGRKKKKEKMIMMKKTIKRGRKPVKERSLKSLM
ncbi:hypothetical protein V5N11_000666 [Cardamine amara subsp. amara]|uniref:Uncharacterized protein n=1 Tax=Cardamine amara subsp. amara TaxID=228776 RepID=A0ABD1BHC7_CARAN